MKFSYNEATALIVKGLIDGKEITALNGGQYLTTRVANHICALREDGLKIDTERLKGISGKPYGSYKIVKSYENYQRANELLEQIEFKLSVKQSA